MAAKATAHTQNFSKNLISWFEENRRDLPWRKNRDPYRIWIAEVMLQQTTTRAVIPFYERFMERFPTLADLAEANEETLYPYWAGLGYYSRARNLLKAAKLLEAQAFPRSAAELNELPGFGPYTARAVSSQAFGEKVGVVDGNVIRVLSRFYGQAFRWWMAQDKRELQCRADALVQSENPGELNQALMELGATICTPKSPSCFLCPWRTNCVALAEDRVDQLPVTKPRRASEVWLWEAKLIMNKDKLALIENDYAPFLKAQWFFPGQAKKLKTPPKDFDFTHGITHHKIYVRILKSRVSRADKSYRWIDPNNLSKINPASLLEKALLKGDLL